MFIVQTKRIVSKCFVRKENEREFDVKANDDGLEMKTRYETMYIWR